MVLFVESTLDPLDASMNPEHPQPLPESIETIRHGAKQGEALSAEGIEQARGKAGELLTEIEAAEPGMVFYVIPSNVGRAIETRRLIEDELRSLCADRPDIAFVDVKDAGGIAEAKSDPSRKYVVTELAPSRLLGFNERTLSIPAFLEYKKRYQNDEGLIGMTWIARQNELPALRERVASRLPDLDLDSIRPNDFIETPEEAAEKYLHLMQRMTEITRQHFPNRPWKGLHIGHNLSADFTAMATLGKPLTLASLDELGGTFRRPVESSTFTMPNQEAEYRGQHGTPEAGNLQELIERLREASEERKREWGIASPEQVTE